MRCCRAVVRRALEGDGRLPPTVPIPDLIPTHDREWRRRERNSRGHGPTVKKANTWCVALTRYTPQNRSSKALCRCVPSKAAQTSLNLKCTDRAALQPQPTPLRSITGVVLRKGPVFR